MKDIRKNFCTVQGWMVQDLDLSGSELLAYALVFGFCQNTESKFIGSIDYIQTWLNVSSRNTVIKTMSSLVDKNLLIKKQNVFNGVTFNEYDINFDKIKECTGGAKNEEVVQKMHYGSAKNELGGSAKNELGGSAFFEPNNIQDKILKKDKNKDKAIAIPSVFSSTEFQQAFEGFEQMRKSMKKPLTENAKKLILNKLESLANGNEQVAIKILENSTMNSWLSVFALKEEDKPKPPKQSNNGQEEEYFVYL